MSPREPAGCERGGGKSAELLIRARVRGGIAGNTCGTVCGKPQVRYPLTEIVVLLGVQGLSVGACLYRLFLFTQNRELERMEGTHHEI